jgi:hypothetical protein
MLLGELPEYKRASLFTNWQIITWSTQGVFFYNSLIYTFQLLMGPHCYYCSRLLSDYKRPAKRTSSKHAAVYKGQRITCLYCSSGTVIGPLFSMEYINSHCMASLLLRKLRSLYSSTSMQQVQTILPLH